MQDTIKRFFDCEYTTQRPYQSSLISDLLQGYTAPSTPATFEAILEVLFVKLIKDNSS